MSKTIVNEIKVDFKNLDDLLSRSAKQVAKDVKNLAPKDTGEYASGITSKKVNENEYKVFNVGDRAYLGHITEFGTINQRAQPHYRPGYEKNKNKIILNLKKLEIEVFKK